MNSSFECPNAIDSPKSVAAVSPFGGVVRKVLEMPVSEIVSLYKEKCGFNVANYFGEMKAVTLLECQKTKVRFWRPQIIAGDELFYQQLSVAWPGYYKTTRWEYQHCRSLLGESSSVLEIGCGEGHFLKSVESSSRQAIGLEFNTAAIRNKVTSYEVMPSSIQAFRKLRDLQFDFVCSFQVLEHVAEPGEFIRDCASAVRTGGILALSTPNYAYLPHQLRLDALDLPPHHLNHFTAESYKRLAKHFGLVLQDVKEEAIRVPRFSVDFGMEYSQLSRSARWKINKILAFAFGANTVIGHSILAVFRRS